MHGRYGSLRGQLTNEAAYQDLVALAWSIAEAEGWRTEAIAAGEVTPLRVRDEKDWNYTMEAILETKAETILLMHIQPNLLGVIHEGAPVVGSDANDQNVLQQRGLL